MMRFNLPSYFVQSEILVTHTVLSQLIEQHNHGAEGQWHEYEPARHRSCVEKHIEAGHVDSYDHERNGQKLGQKEPPVSATRPWTLLNERFEVRSGTQQVAERLQNDHAGKRDRLSDFKLLTKIGLQHGWLCDIGHRLKNVPFF